MTRRVLLTAIALGLMTAASASADVYVPQPVVRPVLSPRLAMVSASAAPDAPAEDVRETERSVRAQLASSLTRVRRCLNGIDLRDDPLRSRTPRMEVRLRFARSGRPTVSVHRNDGMPQAAASCVLEAARAVSLRPAPRGTVLVRAVYTL